CDMMVAGSLETSLAELLEAMERANAAFAAAPDAEGSDIAGFVTLWGVPPFAVAVRAAGIDPGGPISNSGLFLCRLPEPWPGCATLDEHRLTSSPRLKPGDFQE
uniref:hypothetical protein n=1 Tax=Sabulibacter ruber TaxID=2811901 RepID=UPI001A97804B